MVLVGSFFFKNPDMSCDFLKIVASTTLYKAYVSEGKFT